MKELINIYYPSLSPPVLQASENPSFHRLPPNPRLRTITKLGHPNIFHYVDRIL